MADTISSSQIEFSTAQRASLAPVVLGLGLGLAVTVSASEFVTTKSRTHDVALAAASHKELSAICALLYSRAVVDGQFQALVAQWRADTTYTSNLEAMIMHWAYQRIIGLGPQVVPSILAQLQRAPDHWGPALGAITGADPVPADAEGDVEAIAQAWLDWGRARDLVPTDGAA